MHELLTFASQNTERLMFVTLCIFGVAFLVWFLVALLLDERRMRERRRSGSSKNRTSTVSIQLDLTQIPAGGPHEKNPGNNQNNSGLKRYALHDSGEASSRERALAPRLHVFRLPDMNIEKSTTKLRWLVMAILCSATIRLSAQTTDPTSQKDQTTEPAPTLGQQKPDTQPADPTPLTTPAITGPLQAAPPIEFDAGPLGKLDLDGIVSGMGLWQGNHIPGDDIGQSALSNGQVFIQKTTGCWQFYVQAGAYNILPLGTPFLPTDKALTDLYGPVPVAFVKLVPGKNTSILVGALPNLDGS